MQPRKRAGTAAFGLGGGLREPQRLQAATAVRGYQAGHGYGEAMNAGGDATMRSGRAAKNFVMRR